MTRDEMLALKPGDRVHVNTSDPYRTSAVFEPTNCGGAFVRITTIGRPAVFVAEVRLDEPLPYPKRGGGDQHVAAFGPHWLSRTTHPEPADG